MAILYCAELNAFFLNTLPSYAEGKASVQITSFTHLALLAEQSAGKLIQPDENGNPIAVTPTPPSAMQLFLEAAEAVRTALQQAIDTKAREFGFSAGNALMLYAGFANDYQTLAQTFATWEVSVWTEANDYKAEVIAGNQPMLTPAQAVAMMPVYPTGA